MILAGVGVGISIFFLAFGIATFHGFGMKEIAEWTLLLQDLSFCSSVGVNGVPKDQLFLVKVMQILSIFNFEFRVAAPGCDLPAITLLDEFWATLMVTAGFAFLFFWMSFLHGYIIKWR